MKGGVWSKCNNRNPNPPCPEGKEVRENVSKDGTKVKCCYTLKKRVLKGKTVKSRSSNKELKDVPMSKTPDSSGSVGKKGKCPRGTRRDKKTLRCKRIPPGSLRDIVRVYKNKSYGQVYPYKCIAPIQVAMTLHLLKSNYVKCGAGLLPGGKFVRSYGRTGVLNTYPLTRAKAVAKFKVTFKKCVENKEPFVIPINIVKGAHSNMLIFNPIRKEVERFEPHGAYTGISRDGFNEVRLNLNIAKFIEEIAPEYEYLPPNRICPVGFRGFQSYQSSLDESGSWGGVKITNGGGYCCAWSYFYADMRLKFPALSGEQIMNKAYEVLGKEPQVLKDFIRGQFMFLVPEIDSIDKRYRLLDTVRAFEERDKYENIKKKLEGNMKNGHFESDAAEKEAQEAGKIIKTANIRINTMIKIWQPAMNKKLLDYLQKED